MSALASNKRRLKCPVCERAVDRKSRQQNFCSTRCRMKAFREKTPVGSGHTGGVTNPPKFRMKTMFCSGQKRGRAFPLTAR